MLKYSAKVEIILVNGGDPYVHDSVSCHRSCGYRGEYLPAPEGSRPERGQSLPSVDNLYALSALLQVPMNEIIISTSHIVSLEQQAAACCSGLFMWKFLQVQWAWQNFKTA